MTYEEALSYIHRVRPAAAPRRDLNRMRAIMEYLGNPQDKLKYVHIAGTNGKGSTSAMTAAVLSRAGYKTGLYTSPYVYDFRERICVDGEMIDKDALARLVSRVKRELEAFSQKTGLEPTEFELVTALAFCHFRETGCDIVCLETGIGGLLDVTNIVDKVECAVITSIGRDHMPRLGTTLAEVAAHKCGIIKPGAAIVCAMGQAAEVLKVIKETCIAKGSSLIIPEKDKLAVLASDPYGSTVQYCSNELYIPLAGEHQVTNALTVYEVCRALREKGWRISDEHIKNGIASVKWPGRFEVINKSPWFILDGAHNEGAVKALAKSLSNFFGGRKIICVIGMMADKEYERCAEVMADVSDVMLCVAANYPRAVSSERLSEVLKRTGVETHDMGSVQNGVRRAMEITEKDDVIIVCGSMYILEEARDTFRETTN